jgi:conjugative transfer signal peptidase TraF
MTPLDTRASLGAEPPIDHRRSGTHAQKPKGTNPFLVIAVAGALIVLGRLAYPVLGPPLLINHTASEPRGLYWLEIHDSKSYARGQLVAMSTPPGFRTLIESRGWAPDGGSLLKGVAALEGDLVCTNDHEVTINGRRMGPISSMDSAGRPLPELRGCYSVPEGEFLPLSTLIPNSFDGRYMGPQPLWLIRGEAHRLWTF